MELIDQKQLNDCMTGEPELDQDLMQTAIEEIVTRLATMRLKIQNNDHTSWKRDTHLSLGTTGTLGFSALAAAFRTAEHHAGDHSERTQLLDNLDQLVQNTKQELIDLGLIKN